ncbi:MAG: hypothetical protein PHY72_03435 [Candidatus Pacebacteria bacterium]|nr:hypothetical protein [Candidatus Paceibacterota bacterium]
MKHEICNIRHKALKKVLFGFLVVIFILMGRFALALELSYPNIPGLGRLSDYQNVTTSQQIGFITSYIFKLVFFISIGAGLIALLVSGVLYIVSSSRPKYLTLSKQMASNAMLGLFILICAYLFLYFINPQLLSLTLQKPELKQITSTTASPYNPNTVVAQRVSFAGDLNSSLDNLEEEIHIDKNNQYYEKINGKDCLTDGYGGTMDKNGKYLRDMDEKDPVRMNGCVLPTKNIVAIAPSKNNQGFWNKVFAFLFTGAQATGEVQDQVIYRAEIPLRETADALKKVAQLVLELQDLQKKCQCGISLGYSDTSLGNSGCKPGLEDKTKITQNQMNGQACLNQADNCGTAKDYNGCLTCDLHDVRETKDGAIQVCARYGGVCKPDQLVGDTIKSDPCWILITDANTEGLLRIPTTPDDCQKNNGVAPKDALFPTKIKVDALIKYKVLQIQEQQAKLQARAKIDARFLDSADLILRALNANSIEFSTSQATGYWGFDFANEAKKIQDAGYPLVVLNTNGYSDMNAPIVIDTKNKSGFLARLKSLFSPLTANFAWAQSMYDKQAINDAFIITQAVSGSDFFYIIHAPAGVQDLTITDKNNAIARDARRYNLFSLLTDLPLEGIEQIFRDCLTSAFGQATYNLNQGQIEDVVKAVMDSGAADHLKAVIQNMKDKIAQATIDGIKDGIVSDTNVALIKTYLVKCASAGCKTNNEAAQDIITKFSQNNCPIASALNDTCCYCVKNLISNGVPPNYLSKTFSHLFDASLASELPNISSILNTNVINILFPNDSEHTIGKFLNTPMKNVYDTIFKGALSTPFQDQIPGLNTLLDKQMKDVLPSFIVNQITSFNNWFDDTVSSTKSLAKSASKNMADALVKEYVGDPMHEWAQNQFDKLGIGIEHLTLSACFEKLEQGYVYKDNNGQYLKGRTNFVGKTEADSGKCVLMTPGEITTLAKQEIEVPQSFVFEDATDLSETAKIKSVKYFSVPKKSAQSICGNVAGYAWDGSEGGSGCYKQDNLAQDAKAAADTITSLDKTETYIAGGMVNYAEKMATAFTETALQFALAYARVFVEDNFINPLMGYWNAISGFQQGMEDFLTTSVRGILPAQISGILQSNITTQLGNFCDQYKKEKAKLTDIQKANNEEVKFNFTIDMPKGVFWDGKNSIEQKMDIPQETGDAICKIDKAFNTTPWQEITIMCDRNNNTAVGDRVPLEDNLCKGVETLNSKLIDVLSSICIGGEDKCFDINNWFNRPLLSIFFPNSPLDAIKKLVGKDGTPKNLVCGTLPILKQENNNFIAPASLCQNIISSQFGIIPVFKKDSELTSDQINLKPWCAFVYGACSPSVAFGQTTVGKIIKDTIVKSCGSYGNQANCPGQCYCKYYCPKITNSSCYADENVCQTCSSLAQNSIFYSLISLSTQKPLLSDRSSSQKNDETQFYADMDNDFPVFDSDIQAAAKKREIAWTDVEEKKRAGFGLSSFVEILNKGLSVQDLTLRNLLKQDEILGLTPYQAFVDKVCPQTEEGTDERAFCDMLNQAPKEVFGLDLPLKNYIKPEEFQILFDMLQDLKDGSPSDCQKGEQFIERGGQGLCCDANLNLCYKVGEKPAGLSQLLDYMETRDPIDALRELQQTMPVNDTGFSGVFPYITTISDSMGCLALNKTVRSGCSPTIIADLQANGLPIDDLIVPADQNINVFFEKQINVPQANILGMLTDKRNAVAVSYYFYKPTAGENLILVYREPNPAKVAFGDTLDFMTTPIGDIMDKLFSQQTIADYICNQIDPALCDAKIDTAWKNNSAKITDILKSTPLDLVATYLNKPLSIKSGQSLMDAISANTALGQPIVDTLGALTGLDALIGNKIGGPITNIKDWADKGAKSGVKALQDGLQSALVDWPQSIAPQWLAEFYGFNVGKNTANDIAGAPCYPQPTTGAMAGQCDTKKGEVERITTSNKKECCILAKGESCQPRCREVDDKVLQCDVLSGERPSVEQQFIDGAVHRICCFAGSETNNPDDNTSYGFQTTEPLTCRPKPLEGCEANEVENPNDNSKCCVPVIKFCKKARAVNFDAGGKCRASDENGDSSYETKDQANGVCKFYETYKQTLPPLPTGTTPTVEDQGYCCSTVSQCIVNRFSSHLENVAEMMADGQLPLDSLTK